MSAITNKSLEVKRVCEYMNRLLNCLLRQIGQGAGFFLGIWMAFHIVRGLEGTFLITLYAK